MSKIFEYLGAVIGQPHTSPEMASLLSALANGLEDRDMTLDDVEVNNLSGPRFKITPEGGYAIRILNGTGAASVKGTTISASTTADFAGVLQANTYDCFGICYESGIPDGQLMWVVIAGIADVLLVDGQASARGQLALSSATDGRATTVQNPGTGLPGTDLHFTEIGHVIETKQAGTDVLARCVVHFN